ncbi:MAG TPA: DUF2442 domain-containing protein [Tepidisphaeraceae bacterium]|nr:DUF2442 domain-containing protein [Tepidisphaeraceae bacterium]
MTPSDDALILIERAEPAGDFKLRLTFNDATQRTVDFGPFLRGSGNPLIRAYLDPAAFARFEIKDGDLVWGDYDLCFPIADLYDGRV